MGIRDTETTIVCCYNKSIISNMNYNELTCYTYFVVFCPKAKNQYHLVHNNL